MRHPATTRQALSAAAVKVLFDHRPVSISVHMLRCQLALVSEIFWQSVILEAPIAKIAQGSLETPFQQAPSAVAAELHARIAPLLSARGAANRFRCFVVPVSSILEEARSRAYERQRHAGCAYELLPINVW